MKIINVYDSKGKVKAEVLVSDEDFEYLSRWKWGLSTGGYPKRNIKDGGKRRTLFMHRVIMGLDFGDVRVVDHKNGNKLDNRRENLRVASVKQNRENVKSYKASSSKYRGVTWHKGTRKWQVQVKVNGVDCYLGLFTSEDEAGAVATKFIKEKMPFYFDEVV